jgi:hypothetical protein
LQELWEYDSELMAAHLRAWLSFENHYVSLSEHNASEGHHRGSRTLWECTDHVQLVASLANWIDLGYIISGSGSGDSSGSSSGSGSCSGSSSGSGSKPTDPQQYVHTVLLRELLQGLRILLSGDKQPVG